MLILFHVENTVLEKDELAIAYQKAREWQYVENECTHISTASSWLSLPTLFARRTLLLKQAIY